MPRQPLGYYICSGYDPSIISNLKLKAYGVVELSSLMLNLVICARIKIFRNPKIQPLSLNKSEPVLKKGLFLKEVEAKSLPSVATVMANMVLLLFLTLTVALTNAIDPKNINNFPQTLMVSIS